MSLTSRVCYLRSLRNAQKRINLPHEKPVIIGRNEETGVTDIHVSRNHLQCTADVNDAKVSLKTLGKSFSGCNGYALMRGETYTLKHGDIIEVRLGFHEFEIVFESLDESPDIPLKKQKVMDCLNLKPKQKVSTKGKWEEIDGKDLLIYTPDNCAPKAEIAAFDLDGTIIKTKSGARFPKDHNDWVLNFINIGQKLQKLHHENYKIVVFTNQPSLGNEFSKIKGFKGKIEAVIDKLSVPAQVFIATGRSIYRKPIPGMWNVLVDSKNGGTSLDIEKSFYVGDAAGREKNWAPNKNKDHSKADRLFALNIGLQFRTPEEYFLNASPVKHAMPEFNPKNLPHLTYPPILIDNVDVVLMVGGPGSGKTYFCKNQLIPKGYVSVSRDELGTWQKCSRMLEEYLQKGQRVVIDNTNPDKQKRQRFLEVAKKCGVPCRCFLMTTSFRHAKHNNRFREITVDCHKVVGDLVFNSFNKNYQEPEMSEGFSEIVKIPFVGKFDTEELEKLYKLFLLED